MGRLPTRIYVIAQRVRHGTDFQQCMQRALYIAAQYTVINHDWVIDILIRVPIDTYMLHLKFKQLKVR